MVSLHQAIPSSFDVLESDIALRKLLPQWKDRSATAFAGDNPLERLDARVALCINWGIRSVIVATPRGACKDKG